MNKQRQLEYINILKKIKLIFEQHNIIWWIDGGSLLCLVRDKDLSYEYDLDIGTFYENWDIINSILKDVCSIEPKTRYKIYKPRLIQILFANSEDKRLDIYFWHKVNIYRTYCGTYYYTVPSEYFKDIVYLSYEKLDTELFPCPKQYINLIEDMYGRNWNKHMTREEYLQWLSNIELNTSEIPNAIKFNPVTSEYWVKLKQKPIYILNT